jgi:REP element-mobilizing transposase RayT
MSEQEHPLALDTIISHNHVMSSEAQLSLKFRTWGGRRKGAGRPKVRGSGMPHAKRPRHSKDHPVHVTWRAVRGLPSLRGRRAFGAVRRSLAKARERLGGRVVHFSVQRDHIHLIVEANGRAELLGALRALGIRIARAINGAFERRGRALSDRYHAHVLRSPLEVKEALAYVLSNSKHHILPAAGGRSVGILDGCSSAPWFDGWAGVEVTERALLVPATGPPKRADPPVAKARSWLLRVGWKRHGLIDPNEVPGERRKRRPEARRGSMRR